MATKKIFTLDEFLNGILEDKVFDGQPALSWLNQGLWIDEATISLEKPELLKLLSKALLALATEQNKYCELLVESENLIDSISDNHIVTINEAKKLAIELKASYDQQRVFFNILPSIITNAKQKALSNNAKKAVKKKLESDPKQNALKAIQQEYKNSSSPFHIHGHKAKFAREMHKKHPAIESIKTIERLVAKLSKKSPSAS